MALKPFHESSVPDFSGTIIQSWGNFIKMESAKANDLKDLQLYVNEAFAAQELTPYDKTEGDKYGPINIPSKFDFWLILLNNNFYVVNSRRGISLKIVDKLDMSTVVKTHWMDKFGNAYPPVSTLDDKQFGYCMKIKLKEIAG